MMIAKIFYPVRLLVVTVSSSSLRPGRRSGQRSPATVARVARAARAGAAPVGTRRRAGAGPGAGSGSTWPPTSMSGKRRKKILRPNNLIVWKYPKHPINSDKLRKNGRKKQVRIEEQQQQGAGGRDAVTLMDANLTMNFK